MKKAGIITIIDNDNYGNRLQNYAVQKILDNHGISSITILNSNHTNIRKNCYLRSIKNILRRNESKLQLDNTYSNNQKRKKNFQDFNDFIKFSKKKYVIQSKFDFDYLIVGSDQVWNPYFGRLSDLDLLNVKNKNKIAFSASFGVEHLPNDVDYCKLSNCLRKFKAISIREVSGKRILDDIIPEQDVTVLIDPTMLLKDYEWDIVSKMPTMLKEKNFILNYFLGELNASRAREINKIATAYGCEVINILDKKSPFFECGPSEFLYLIKHASLICTDSFHSSVFAILYNKPFVVFRREEENGINMNTRLETLLDKFKLENRYYNEKKITEENLNHNYSEAYKILEQERNKSNKFIEKALSLEGE